MTDKDVESGGSVGSVHNAYLAPAGSSPLGKGKSNVLSSKFLSAGMPVTFKVWWTVRPVCTHCGWASLQALQTGGLSDRLQHVPACLRPLSARMHA